MNINSDEKQTAQDESGHGQDIIVDIDRESITVPTKDVASIFLSHTEVALPPPDWTKFRDIAAAIGTPHLIRRQRQMCGPDLVSQVKPDAYAVTSDDVYLGFKTPEGISDANNRLHSLELLYTIANAPQREWSLPNSPVCPACGSLGKAIGLGWFICETHQVKWQGNDYGMPIQDEEENLVRFSGYTTVEGCGLPPTAASEAMREDFLSSKMAGDRAQGKKNP